MNELFQIPATHRPKLDVWKERYGVWTHHAPHCEEAPWTACAARDFIKTHPVKPEDATDLPSLYAAWCRIIDEHGFDATAMTEGEACFALAEKCAWPFLESITEADCRLAP